MRAILRLFIRALVCAAAAPSLGGFVLGFKHCADCAGFMSRAMLGLIWAMLAPLYGGHIPADGGSRAPRYNAWEYGVPLALVLFVTWTALAELLRRHSQQSRQLKSHRA